MTSRRTPLPFVILRALGADSSLLGDLAEEAEFRRSSLWLWRQLLGAAPQLLIGRARQVQPHRPKTINLSAAPAGSPAGGLGLLAFGTLMTVVAPESWLLVAIGVAGGAALGAALILTTQHRLQRPPRDFRTLHL